ncbi:MAG TPA: MFS transporter, partial [Micromonosporaceae bacterium]|nr:MFS transporter [Micromonosporaceae bacterium]
MQTTTQASDTSTVETGAVGAQRGRTAPEWATLLVVLTGTFMITLDFFIVNVAIPTTQRELHATSGQVQWIVAGYGLALASGVITAGRLGDLYGRRRVYAIGLALFTVASLACGVAGDAAQLVTARIFQGAAAAVLTPQVLAIISTAFTGKARTRAFTVYGLILGVAAVFGQLIGGARIRADVWGLSWRACFLINLPIGVAALALVRRTVPGSAGARGTRLDLIGAALVTTALFATVLPLIQGRAQGWPVWTYLSFGVAAVLFAVFVAHLRRTAARGGVPLIEPSMFASRGLVAATAAQFVFWLGQASFFLVLALYLQDGRGLTALATGVVFTAIGVGYMAASSYAGRIAARLGRQAVALGTLIMAVALATMEVTVLAIGTHGSIGWLVPTLVLDGVGMGIALSPLASTMLSFVPARHAGAGSGVLSTVMQVAGAVGVAVVGVVFFNTLGTGGFPHAFAASLTFLTCVEV